MQGSERAHGEVTLEDFVVEIWAGVDSKGRADCPICTGHRLHAAGCSDCGARLS